MKKLLIVLICTAFFSSCTTEYRYDHIPGRNGIIILDKKTGETYGWYNNKWQNLGVPSKLVPDVGDEYLLKFKLIEEDENE